MNYFDEAALRHYALDQANVSAHRGESADDVVTRAEKYFAFLSPSAFSAPASQQSTQAQEQSPEACGAEASPAGL